MSIIELRLELERIHCKLGSLLAELDAEESTQIISADSANFAMTLTKELIEACRTHRGAFTNSTIRALGLSKSMLAQGWPKRLIGTTISGEAYSRALKGRMIYASGPLD